MYCYKNTTMKLLILVFTLFFSTYKAQDSIRAKLIEPVHLTSYYSKNVVRSKHFVNISDDKEFAILFNKRNDCSLGIIKINIKEYLPKSDNEFIFLKFYKNNNNQIGDEYTDNRMLIKLKNKKYKDFQILFNLKFSKIIENNSFFIGITLSGEKTNNSILRIYSSEDENTILYIRNNKIDYWIEESKIEYSKDTKYFFPSLQITQNCK